MGRWMLQVNRDSLWNVHENPPTLSRWSNRRRSVVVELSSLTHVGPQETAKVDSETDSHATNEARALASAQPCSELVLFVGHA